MNIGEYDKLITVLTGSHGLVKAFVRGARRVKSKRLSATALLTYGDFTFEQSRGGLSVTEAEPVEVFFGLRENVTSLALAQYLCELASELVRDEMPAPEELRLILNSLHFLSVGKKSAELIKAVTELRLMCLSGFSPSLVACRECSEYGEGNMYFDTADGTLCCEGCAKLVTGNMVLCPHAVVEALRHIAFSDFSKVYSFTITDGAMSVLSSVTQAYLLDKTERTYNSLEFYNTLKE